MKRINIFRAGRHTSRGGQTLTFSEVDLKAAAAAYDPALHEAPIVVGHPTTDGPAYGWVRGLHATDDGLDAEPHQVDADFSELVERGAFKKVSASFYLPDSPHNPKPGVLYLRHVGFLGAHPPAIKGLRPVEFGEGEEGVIEFADWADRRFVTLFRRLRDFIVEKFSVEDADRVVPVEQLDWMVEDIAAEEAERRASMSTASPAAFSEPIPDPIPTPEPMKTEEQKVKEAAERASEQEAKQEAAKHEAAFAERESRLAEREARIAEQEADTRRRSFTDFAEGLKGADGRAALLPRQVPVLVGAMEALASSDATVEFGEGDEAEEKPALGALQGLVAELTAGIPGQVDFSERARAENGAAQDDPETVEARAARIAEYVEDARQKGRAVSYAQALTELDAAKAAK